METLIVELCLWALLIFFFWAFRQSIKHMKINIEALGLLESGQLAKPTPAHRIYDQPDKVLEVIGRYQEAPIYRYAMIDGQLYRFDHIDPVGPAAPLENENRCLAPGLIYVPISAPE